MSRDLPRPEEIWWHFKNTLYRIIAIAQHTETDEKMAVCQAMYGNNGIYARPLDMFMSKVDHEKYPDVEQEYRFERVGNSSLLAVCREILMWREKKAHFIFQ